MGKKLVFSVHVACELEIQIKTVNKYKNSDMVFDFISNSDSTLTLVFL